jgi:hypothetical protein
VPEEDTMKLNKAHLKAIRYTGKPGGFIHLGDACFRTYHQTKVVIGQLEREGYLDRIDDEEFGPRWVLSEKGRDVFLHEVIVEGMRSSGPLPRIQH